MQRLLIPEQFGSLYICPADGTEQEQHTIAHALLREALSAYTWERQIFLPDMPVLAHTEKGKPYFPDYPAVHFNLSHCRGMAVCLLSQHVCGVDVEQRRPLREKVVSRVFSAEERSALEMADDPDFLFTRLWTLKESYVKAIGIGVSYPMREVCFSLTETDIFSNRPDADFRNITEGNFSISVCVLKPQASCC